MYALRTLCNGSYAPGSYWLFGWKIKVNYLVNVDTGIYIVIKVSPICSYKAYCMLRLVAIISSSKNNVGDPFQKSLSICLHARELLCVWVDNSDIHWMKSIVKLTSLDYSFNTICITWAHGAKLEWHFCKESKCF